MMKCISCGKILDYYDGDECSWCVKKVKCMVCENLIKEQEEYTDEFVNDKTLYMCNICSCKEICKECGKIITMHPLNSEGDMYHKDCYYNPQ